MRLSTTRSATPHSWPTWIATWSLFAVGVLAPPLCVFLLDVSLVLGRSMAPTILEPGMSLVWKRAIDPATITRGDLVSLFTLDGAQIKRVIGLPGETVILASGSVYVVPNEENSPRILIEPYLEPAKSGTYRFSGPPNATYAVYQIPPEHFFVLADNRMWGADSRSYVQDGCLSLPYVPFYAIDSRILGVLSRNGWNRVSPNPPIDSRAVPWGLIAEPLGEIDSRELDSRTRMKTTI